ncbi:PQQ-dependent sugar dehydrogenase [Hymenobacter arizonensis]|uniref:Glucose/arabinose dehydrogenase, beta-propeller fold n=1 Tax=Hymenobacter arizonensis TaxID=1227077 RepID=A0A1I5TS57_HYMAR|nr:PQQ-dependent sugar dehydrogenase [Hymenobacter arizonensis]SFP85894.1 Glucose/arabinose dehydrogenase, beta-propeller fold [Hymenobacter arizonensis]
MKQHLLLLLGCSAAVLSCTRDAPAVPDTTTTPAPTGAPVETNAPNADYRPAFAGQTRVGSVTTPASSYRSAVIASSLSSPWGVVTLPGGRLLVTEKTGRMRIVTSSGAVSEPITGLPAVNAGGQGGLLGVCLDPDFATNRMVYWSFAEARPGGNLTAIAKGRLADNERTIEGATVIYRADPAYGGTLHYGGRVVFDRTGHLVVSTGERSDLATRPQAQSVASGLGKLMRITRDGQPAPGNPVFTQAGARPELYSIGHRNPQGLAIHPVTGEVWQSEHGPRGGDELNRIQAGANYGWPTVSYGIEYGGQPIGSGIQQGTGLTQPVYYWDPVVSPSGMTFYAGNRVPEWQNNLFIGALSGTHIIRLVIDNNQVVGEERLLASEAQRFRDVTQGTDGALYAITDQGRLYRIDRP